MDGIGSSPEADPALRAGQRSHRVALGLFALHFLWAVSSYSQKSSYFFGSCADFPVELDIRDLAVSPRTADQQARIALLPSSASSLLLFTLDSTGTIVRADTCSLPDGQRMVVSADLDRDGRDEFVTYNSERGEVNILRESRNGIVRQTLEVPPLQRLSIADINSDGYPDILLYGKTSAGVVTYLNRRNERFVRGQVLFPDISVSDLQVRDLDGDGVNDVFLLDWLSNKLDVFYGISRTVFSEQLSIDLAAEPEDLSVGAVTRQRTTRIGITFPALRKIVLYDGNALGEFAVATSIECPSSPHGVAIKDINRDGQVDVISSTEHGILVRSGTSLFSNERTQFYAPSTSRNLWAVADLDGDGYPDLVVMDPRTHRLRLLYNDYRRQAPEPVQSYAVGIEPLGVSIGDVDGDGMGDVLVANEGSNTVSSLVSRGDGTLHGQQAFLAGEAPSRVMCLQRGTTDLVVAHTNSGRVRIMSLQSEKRYSSIITMPAGNRPEILDASFNRRERRIEIMLRSHDEGGRGTTLTFLEQLSRRQFLERTFRPTVASPVLAATAKRQDPAGDLAVLFACFDSQKRRTTVYTVRASPTFEFGPVSSVFSFPDSLSRTFLLTWGEDHDAFSSTASIAVGDPYNSIGVFSVAGDTLGSPVRWVEGVRPVDEAALVYADVDDDGIPDLVVADALQSTVRYYRGISDGGFAEPVAIAPTANMGGFAVGPVVTTGGDDLIISDRREGIIRLFVDPFRRKGE